MNCPNKSVAGSYDIFFLNNNNYQTTSLMVLLSACSNSPQLFLNTKTIVRMPKKPLLESNDRTTVFISAIENHRLLSSGNIFWTQPSITRILVDTHL